MKIKQKNTGTITIENAIVENLIRIEFDEKGHDIQVVFIEKSNAKKVISAIEKLIND